MTGFPFLLPNFTSHMRYLTAFALILMSSTILAQDVDFFTGDWAAANAKAKAENKVIMVDAYTDWCGPCKMMDKEMFHGNQAVADLLNSEFVPVKIDCERGFGIQFSQKFRVTGYPSLLFFSPEGQLIDRHLGYNPDTDQFVASLEKATELDMSDPYGYDATRWDVPFPDFYLQAFRNQDDSTWSFPKDIDQDAWLDQREDLYDEASWGVMFRFGLSDTYRSHFEENYAAYQERYRKEAERKMQEVIYGRTVTAAKEKDKEAFQAVLNDIEKYFPGDPDDYAYWMKSTYFRTTEDWKAYASMMSAAIADPEREVGIGEINGVAWTLYEKCDDQSALEESLGWFEPFLSELKDYYVLDTYAALLFKTSRLEEAERWALRAIEAGKEADMNVEETENLLERIREAVATGGTR